MTTAAGPTITRALLAEEPARPPVGLWTDAWRRLVRNRAAIAGLVVIVGLILMAILASALAPYSYEVVDYDAVQQAPGPAHLFGTDGLGRDMFSRIIYGSRVSMSVGVVVQLVIVLIGLPIGLIAGYAGGRVDNLLMRFTDVMYAFPELLFAIILMTTLRGTIFDTFLNGLFPLFLAIGVASWPTMARLARGQVLSLKQKEFVEAARATGASHVFIVTRHLLPNILSPLIVAVTLGVPHAIMTEAVLSFIGLGVQPPMPSWGSLIEDGWKAIFVAPYLVIFPGLAIAITMLAFTFLGDGLRDALDPRMKD